MKKILLVFDGPHFSTGAFDFACRLNEISPVAVTGVFLPSLDYTNTVIYYMGLEVPAYTPMLETEQDAILANVEHFKQLCEKNNIEYRIHTEISGSIPEGLKKESRYSDLMILSSEMFYSNLGSYSQKEYLHDTAHNAECPVILLPESYRFPQHVILAYDGSESSVFAIKQFAYLFPELAEQDTTLVYASEKRDDLPDFDYIQEFAAKHFKQLNFLKLNVDPKTYFDTWVKNLGPALLVTGSYSRSGFSEIFRKSFIRDIVSDRQVPVFIAHK